MRAFICICVSLTLIAPQLALAGNQKSGGGSKAAAHSSGGGSSRAAAHPGGGFPHSSAGAPRASGSGMSTRAGMGQQHNFSNNNAQSAGHAAHTQRGLSAGQSSGQHGSNAHQKTNHHVISSQHPPADQSTKTPTQPTHQNKRADKPSATHPLKNSLVVNNQQVCRSHPTTPLNV